MKPGTEDTTSFCVNIVKSLRWPGAVTVACGNRFTSVYVGYGVKRGDVCFSPIEPPEVMSDPIDFEGQPEPTPLHEPVERVEEDTKDKEDDDEDY